MAIDEKEGVVGVKPTPDGGTKGVYPIPKGVTPFLNGGQPPTANRNAEPGSLLSSTRLENDPQADIDKCQGEMKPKRTSTLGTNEENRFLTDTPTRSKGDEDEAVTKGKGVLWPMHALTVLKWWLPFIVLIWVVPPSAAVSAFTNVTGPTHIYAGCTYRWRCENNAAENLSWFQGWGSDKKTINPSARFEIDGPSRRRPSGVLSSTLTIRNVSEEDVTISCYDGVGHSGSMHKVEVLPRVSCGSLTPPDDMWSEYHCDHVTVGCKNNSGSWLLQCLNGTWQGQYGPCHEMETPNDCTWQIVVAVVSSSVVTFIEVVVVVVVVVICKRRRKTLNSMKEKEKADCDDSDQVNREQTTVKL